MKTITSLHSKDMREIFMVGDLVKANSTKSGCTIHGVVTFVGPFICTVRSDGLYESYNFADFLSGRIKVVK